MLPLCTTPVYDIRIIRKKTSGYVEQARLDIRGSSMTLLPHQEARWMTKSLIHRSLINAINHPLSFNIQRKCDLR